jgi:hypothetical protein
MATTRDFLVNKNKHDLIPLELGKNVALYRVQDSDVYFIAGLEKETNAIGITTMHLSGGANWETAGRYINSKDEAFKLFMEVSTKDTKAPEREEINAMYKNN